MIITVGNDKGVIRTRTNEGIQIAVDALAQRGGGTVKVLPGQYVFTGPLWLRSDVTVKGAGPEKTVFKRTPAVTVSLIEDADTGQKEVHPADAAGFPVGTGFCMRDKNYDFSKLAFTVTAVKNGVLYTDRYIEHDIIAENGGEIYNYFNLVQAEETENAVIRDLTLDGTATNDVPWRYSVWGGNIYLRRCKKTVIRNVASLHAHGDGIRCGGSSDTVIENCEVAENTHYGIHPGSHSSRAVVRKCQVHHNGSDGVYFCWGVRGGKILDCDIHHNGLRIFRNGISTGHKDTDTLFKGNHVWENAKHGIHVRIKTAANGAHRTVMENNVIENNGWTEAQIPREFKKLPALEKKGHGIYINGTTRDMVVRDNTIRETRKGTAAAQRIGITVEKDVINLKMAGNRIGKHPEKTINRVTGKKQSGKGGNFKCSR